MVCGSVEGREVAIAVPETQDLDVIVGLFMVVPTRNDGGLKFTRSIDNNKVNGTHLAKHEFWIGLLLYWLLLPFLL